MPASDKSGGHGCAIIRMGALATKGRMTHSRPISRRLAAMTSFSVDAARRMNDLWWAEIDRWMPDEDDFDNAGCAELAEELDLFRIQAEADPNFFNIWADWDAYVVEHTLWLPLEQCCAEGVLLPMGQRELRVQTCPPELLRSLRWFFELCPTHVKHYLALYYYVIGRMDRARRTGSPEWSPSTAERALEERTFFRPPKLTVRHYSG